jgi:uracil-DNA glycosylase
MHGNRVARATTGAETGAKSEDVATWVRAGMERAGGGRPRLGTLRAAAAGCQACPLWARATQTVFGEGRLDARLMLVGEQPGDQEDQQGAPFVGPAGRILDQALERADIDRRHAYVTNAVKHFKWSAVEPRGRRRLHEKPSAREVAACKPWLAAEIDLLQPDVIVALGATAAQALLGSGFRLTAHRGERLHTSWAPSLLATIHPSAVLRMRDAASRDEAFQSLVADLKVARSLLPGRAVAADR